MNIPTITRNNTVFELTTQELTEIASYVQFKDMENDVNNYLSDNSFTEEQQKVGQDNMDLIVERYRKNRDNWDMFWSDAVQSAVDEICGTPQED